MQWVRYIKSYLASYFAATSCYVSMYPSRWRSVVSAFPMGWSRKFMSPLPVDATLLRWTHYPVFTHLLWQNNLAFVIYLLPHLPKDLYCISEMLASTWTLCNLTVLWAWNLLEFLLRLRVFHQTKAFAYHLLMPCLSNLLYLVYLNFRIANFNISYNI